MRRQRFELLSLLALAGAALALPNVATADVINMDEFAVTLNGSQIFDDSFNRSLSLVGGTGTSLSSGTTFASGAPANYFVHGTINETTANNGQAVLDTTNGVVVHQSEPFVPVIQWVAADLQNSHLTLPNTFSAVGLFDLAEPTTILGTYQVQFTNTQPGSPGRTLDMRVRETTTGPVLQFAWLDMAADKFTIINQTPITTTELLDPQVELALALNTAGSDTITAYYAFGSGNTLLSFNGILTAFGSTDSSTDLFSPGKRFALSGFGEFIPVAIPEPSTWAMMLIGFVGLGLAGYRASRNSVALTA